MCSDLYLENHAGTRKSILDFTRNGDVPILEFWLQICKNCITIIVIIIEMVFELNFKLAGVSVTHFVKKDRQN